MVNVDRLKELHSLLLSIPESHFDLSIWMVGFNEADQTFDKLSNECGTSACAIGWACTHPEFNKQGLRYEHSPSFGNSGFPVYGEYEDWEAVRRFFNISDMLAETLFIESNYNKYYDYGTDTYKIRPLDVADRIQVVINNPHLKSFELEELIDEMEDEKWVEKDK